MAGITERNKQRIELANTGFSMKYIDEWQAKTTLYRHKPSYSEDGEINAAVGTAIKGVPGNPDYVLKKAKIGMFPWEPSEGCTCEWSGTNGVCGTATEIKEESVEEPIVLTTVTRTCDVCGFVAEAANAAGAASKMTFYKKKCQREGCS